MSQQASGQWPQTMVYISLGSNLGDSRALLIRAMDRLQALSHLPLMRSALWNTSPVDCPSGARDFINAVVGLTPIPGETPESFLQELLKMEREFGREAKRVRNDARPLDLDLIAFGSERRATAHLCLPHPRAHQRRFVLQPLSEIAPALILPGQAATVSELLVQLPPDPAMRKL